ncbi:MAG: prenyltransferase/squalene oxidase repeat-containing protein [Akkermansia sp.]
MIRTIIAITLGLSLGVIAQEQAQLPTSTPPQTLKTEEAARYASIRNEIIHSIERGNDYLKSKQSPDGIWGSPAYPAMTALACTATMRAPDQLGKPIPNFLKKSFNFILQSQKEDGSIYGRGLASYNTSVCMMALLAAHNPAYDQPLLKARAYLVKQQNHFAPDNPFNGGIGYGDKNSPPIADLSNTSLALEALHYSQQLAKDGKYGKQPDIDWQAAIDFVSRCQSTPSSAKKPGITSDPADQGGFMYRPAPPPTITPSTTPTLAQNKQAQQGQSVQNDPKGQGNRGNHGNHGNHNSRGGQRTPEPLRAYGSMTYAGIQSLIYANLSKNDSRVQAALDWLAKNYSLTENPGVGIDGLYYYYQAMSKALSAAGIDTLQLADGSSIDWRQQLAQQLVTIQKSDGSWVNTSNRWWETDPILVTAYCVLALEQLYNSMPQ